MPKKVSKEGKTSKEHGSSKAALGAVQDGSSSVRFRASEVNCLFKFMPHKKSMK